MKRVLNPKINFAYLDAEDSEAHLETAYARLFKLAKRRLIRRQQLFGRSSLFWRSYMVIPIKHRKKVPIINPYFCDENKISIYG